MKIINVLIIIWCVLVSVAHCSEGRNIDDVAGVVVIYSNESAQISENLSQKYMQGDEFATQIVHNVYPRSAVLIFVQPNSNQVSEAFKPENIDKLMDLDGISKRRGGDDLHFRVAKLKHVRRPVDGILQLKNKKRIYQPNEIATDELIENVQQALAEKEPGDHVMVIFNMDPSATIKDTENAITEALKKFQSKIKDTFAVWTYQIRDTEYEPGEPIFWRDRLMLFYAKDPPIYKDKFGNNHSLTDTNFTTSITDDNLVIWLNGSSINGNFSMRFEDEYDSWCLKDILVDDILHYCRFICAAHDKSYYFRKLILTKNNTIIFPRTQVQPLFRQPDQLKFDEAIHHNFFFTPAILSGLLVSGILLSVIFFAVSMLSTMHTMDRFETERHTEVTPCPPKHTY